MADELPKSSFDLRGPVWLRQERSTERHVGPQHLDLTRSYDQGHGRPAVPDDARELQTVHGAPHFNVSKDGSNVVSTLQNSDRFVSTGRSNSFEPGLLHHVDCAHADEAII